jgi:2-oxoisovalerate dehydrogenase E1 component
MTPSLPPSHTLAKAVLIREVETAFLRLFAEGKIHGTVHTCVGQEFSALAFSGQLRDGDVVFSNHRGHGHFLAFTDDVEGLIAELLARRSGVCAGIGSSQHLCARGFFTNGIQGGIVPCAAGHALAAKLRGQSANVGIVFIGDGTLGEGIVYEAMNLISLLGIPLLIVCEDNDVAQSTPRERAMAGGAVARATAFGITTWSGSTADPAALMTAAADAIQTVREQQRPGFFHVKTSRLNSHSKGDDERAPEIIERLREEDFLNRLAMSDAESSAAFIATARARIDVAVASAESQPVLTIDDYLAFSTSVRKSSGWRPLAAPAGDRRLVTLLQEAWTALMAEHPEVVMIGEDILSPYGGAFKVTKGLSDQHPDRVISTPISEAAITGLANGLALAGMKPVVEIMFGDFITLALDQLLNHAAKFQHMYAGKARCPLILRTPMGGGRGYGPTHSQSLEKLVAGIETITTLALNVLLDPAPLLRAALALEAPVVVIENKLDYARRVTAPDLPGYVIEQNDASFPTIRLRPDGAAADLTLVTYGGTTTAALDATRTLFTEHELLAEVLVLTQIGPVDASPIVESVRTTRRLVTLEEGTAACGIGAEIIARVVEQVPGVPCLRIASLPVPIPSPMKLESQVLPQASSIIQRIAAFCHA